MPKNLQVLSPATLPGSHAELRAGTGRCGLGAVQLLPCRDRASDEKAEKVTARKMILMVRDINAHFGDGKQHVTCYTCHRGSTMPLMEP